jgi:hypothetical protein
MTEAQPSAPHDKTADDIIADCNGDARAAVIELLAIIRSLIQENQTLTSGIVRIRAAQADRIW